MNLSPGREAFFSDAGIAATHWSKIGRADASDAEILAFAGSEKWIIFTHDLDFGALLAASKTGFPSVVQVRAEDVLPQAIGEAVLRALDAARSRLETGALVSVDAFRHRVRILPIE
jgi:predicted nuclease of predicted toxin-antitoxin system